MTRVFRAAAAAAAVAASYGLAPTALGAQTSMAVTCASGVGCVQLRFSLTTVSALSLKTLQLNLSGSTWRFAPLGGPGVYGGEDSVGPLGGFTTLNATGTQSFIDFVGGGFTFDLSAGQTGYVQLEGTTTDPTDLVVDYLGTTNDGTVSGRASFGATDVVPEPATVVLVGGGLAGIAGAARRRRRTATR